VLVEVDVGPGGVLVDVEVAVDNPVGVDVAVFPAVSVLVTV
jgi:hypothetical protein